MRAVSENEAVQRLQALPQKPVIFVDTCNFGNIVRLAYFGKPEIITAEHRALRDGLTNSLFHLVLPEQVNIEFHRPGQFIDVAVRELEQPIKHWNAAVQSYRTICDEFSLNPNDAYQPFDLATARLLYEELIKIAESFLHKALMVESSDSARAKARERQISLKRPARRGKDSFGDCEICETALSVMAALRNNGFSQDAYFVSENKKDYQKDKKLHPDIASDFNRVSLKYCMHISEAYWQIRTQI